MTPHSSYILFFFFNDTATTEIYTLSLHDALPICAFMPGVPDVTEFPRATYARIHNRLLRHAGPQLLTYGTRGGVRSEEHTSELSHSQISYAVFCLKKKKN